jgi:hypothetical protein
LNWDEGLEDYSEDQLQRRSPGPSGASQRVRAGTDTEVQRSSSQSSVPTTPTGDGLVTTANRSATHIGTEGLEIESSLFRSTNTKTVVDPTGPEYWLSGEAQPDSAEANATTRPASPTRAAITFVTTRRRLALTWGRIRGSVLVVEEWLYRNRPAVVALIVTLLVGLGAGLAYMGATGESYRNILFGGKR